jgi:hypothetical protein
MRRSFLVRLPLLLLFGTLSSLLADLSLTRLHGRAAEQSLEKKFELLIEGLKSDRFEKREAATQQLIELEIAAPVLRQALKSSDLEVRLRIANILETQNRNRARRGLTRACTLAKEGRVDEMVERLVCWREWIKGEEEWRLVAELAAGLLEWEHRTYGYTRFLAPGFPRVPAVFRRKNFSPKDTLSLEELARMWTRSRHILGHEIVWDARAVSESSLVVLASGNVRTPTLSCSSILIANGSIHLQGAFSDSIIICQENLEITGPAKRGELQNCLVIARGKLTCPKDSIITDCTILSNGPVVFSEGVKVENTAIVSGGPIVCPKGLALGKRVLITGSIPDWPVKFFDPEFAGLSVWQVYRNNGTLPNEPPLLAFHDGLVFGGGVDKNPDLGAGVQIKKVRKGAPFADGLHESDIVIAVDKEKTPSKESFRKILRRKLAEGGPIITFTVRRTDKILEATWDGHGWLVKHSDKVGRVDQILEVPIRVKD